MYEIENEDHIAIDRNDGNTEYAGEGYGKFMYIFNYGKVLQLLSLVSFPVLNRLYGFPITVLTSCIFYCKRSRRSCRD
jgi:hypothetical protein